MSNSTQIITDFELQVGDVTELSTSEELKVLNRVYQKVCAKRPWEFLKTPASGTVLTDATGSYITLPSDFAFFAENDQYTDNAIGVENNATPKVIFTINTDGAYTPHQIINFSDRRQYKNRSGFAYLDLANGVIRFLYAPTSTSYEFDYIKFPPTLTASDTPLIPNRFQDVLIYGMATENSVLQLSPNATLYFEENKASYQEYILDMAYWNAQFQMS